MYFITFTICTFIVYISLLSYFYLNIACEYIQPDGKSHHGKSLTRFCTFQFILSQLLSYNSFALYSYRIFQIFLNFNIQFALYLEYNYIVFRGSILYFYFNQNTPSLTVPPPQSTPPHP